MPRPLRCLPFLAIPFVFPHTTFAQPGIAADSLYGAADYAGAADLYREAAAQHPDSGRFWYRLGGSLYQVGRPDPAIEALERAVETFRPVSYAHYLLAQVHASAGHAEDAVAEIRRTADAGGVPFAVLVSTEAFAPLASDAEYRDLIASLDPCGGPEYRQFDFWVGAWRIQTPSGPGGFNTITRELNGCVLVERYAGLTGLPAGTSQNFYHKGDRKWHQNWIDGQASNPLWLEGGLNERGEMVMTSVGDGELTRVTWTPNPDGSVRHHSEKSEDGGATWTTYFDGRYVREEAEGAR